jgi:hypothetical protein
MPAMGARTTGVDTVCRPIGSAGSTGSTDCATAVIGGCGAVRVVWAVNMAEPLSQQPA